jgi:GMP synthase (glutamine-hydrolysing)
VKRVLLLKAGTAAASLRLSVGDYDRWFATALRSSPCRLDLIRVADGEKLPTSARRYDAVMMSGSPLSVTVPTAWMKRSGEFLREAAEQKVPVLGVCFGHQLLGYAYGSKVVFNPRGREIGTVEVTLTGTGREDPLFEGLPTTFSIQATHEDIVEQLPKGAILLAENSSTPIQAMAIGPRVRGVQFHPELSPEGMHSLIASRAELLDQEARARGLPHGERVPALFAGVRPTRAGSRILANFLGSFA